MRSRVAIVFASSALAACVALDANAQSAPSSEPSSDNRALAETLFFAGRGLMDAGRYHDACIKLAESHRLDPAAGTLLNLAVCHQKEGRLASAWGEFRQALADAKRMKRDDREQLARDAIAELEPELPYLTITVPSAVRVPGITVKRNGSVINPAAWDTELPVDPGDVEIVTTAPEYKPRTQTIRIDKKEHKSITVLALDPAPIERPPPDYWTARRKTGAALFGVGLVGLGVGTWAGLTTLSDRRESDNNCPVIDGERRCTADGSSAMSRAKTFAIVSDVAFGVAAASLVLGGYFFFTNPHGSEQGAASRQPPRAISWGIAPTTTGASGFVSGSF
jgi:serine/threonine-protein kinase